MKTAIKKRDDGIEALRCVLMFGICLVHATAYSSDRCWWLGNIAKCSVVAFVLISALYGLRLKLRKVVSMVALAAWCAAVVVGIDRFSGGNFIRSFMKQFSSYWFLWCYIALMFVAPLIDKALDACEDVKDAARVVFPVVILALGWNFIASEAAVTLRTKLPAIAGFGSHTFLTLVGIYVAERFMFKWLRGLIPTGRKLTAASVGLMVVVSLDPRLGSSYSPLAVLVAICWVMMCKNVTVPTWAERVARFTAPSLFAVYLLHVSNVGNHALVWLDGKCSFVGCGCVRSLLVSAIVFLTCIAADMPRRLCVWVVDLMQRRWTNIV